MTTKILDLFCCAGGAAMGLYRGFIDRYPDLLIVGVDNTPQPHYPAFHEAEYAHHFRFVQADALNPPFDLSGFDFIWASPLCQGFSRLRNVHKDLPQKYPNLIPQTRNLLIKSGRIYIIENVQGAPLSAIIYLCGSTFGLNIRRHRYFESNAALLGSTCRHDWQAPRFRSSTGRKNLRKTVNVGRWDIPMTVQNEAMGIDWMTREELSEAIPPAYSEYIARQIQL